MDNLNLVIGNNFNFSLGIAKTWGPSTKEYLLSYLFKIIIIKKKLFDINLLKLRLTYKNKRRREDRVEQILDQFLLREEVAAKIPAFHQWVGEGGDSDYLPILLELNRHPKKPITPFKFNPAWLKEDSYNTLFKETWRPVRSNEPREKYYHCLENIKKLKKATMAWARARKMKEEEDLTQIGKYLDVFEILEADGYETSEKMDMIKQLESQRSKILLAREE